MGGLTVSLIEGYPLNLELDSKETYLVYRDIPTTDEEDDLSLDNLKVRERGREGGREGEREKLKLYPPITGCC